MDSRFAGAQITLEAQDVRQPIESPAGVDALQLIGVGHQCHIPVDEDLFVKTAPLFSGYHFVSHL
jgi:hypothetical protein